MAFGAHGQRGATALRRVELNGELELASATVHYTEAGLVTVMRASWKSAIWNHAPVSMPQYNAVPNIEGHKKFLWSAP